MINWRKKKLSVMIFISVFCSNVGNCEVDKIYIKLDYKAKHIDYSKLKKGNYMELMNFISLDGAELHLNSIKLTGVIKL
jgi:hypothetical protein